MKQRLTGIAFALPLLLGAGVALGACPPPTHDRAALESLVASDFELAEDARRQSLAIALVALILLTVSASVMRTRFGRRN